MKKFLLGRINLNDQNELPSIRISIIIINDEKSGQTAFLVIRRFDNQKTANSFFEMINNNSLLNKHNSVVIPNITIEYF